MALAPAVAVSVIFGRAFTCGLVEGARRLSAIGALVDPAWILAKIALESAGTWSVDVLQGRAKLVTPNGPNDMRPEVAGSGGLRLSHGNGARGLFQRMPPRRLERAGKADLLYLYTEPDPVRQLADAVLGWSEFARKHRTGGFKSRAALYCANLAPARLIGGGYDGETILYSANEADRELPLRTYWPEAYRQNAAPFGLDPRATGKPGEQEGRLRMKHLDYGLDAAVRATTRRYTAELEAVLALIGDDDDSSPDVA